MKIGDSVKLIRIPPELKNDRELKTRSLFEMSLGKAFPIADLKSVEGLSQPLVQLDVGHVLGKAEYLDSICVETDYLFLEKQE